MNKVDHLLEHPFESLSKTDQITVQKLGPDRPSISIIQQHKTQSRYFNTNWYYRKDWLTASENKKTLFCFYCLIFGGDVAWTRHGIKDLKHLSERIKNHEYTTRHRENTLKINYFREINKLENEKLTLNLTMENSKDSTENNAIPIANNFPEIIGVKQEIIEIAETSLENIKSEHNSATDLDYNHQKRQRLDDNNIQLNIPRKENWDAIDLLFLSYAKTLKTLPKKKQILLKTKISQILMDAEMEEI